ncbi:MAG: hypothetical protein ACI93R_001310 [Flavobacteriales bacterium]|jgi:uncharacterized protein YigA (DUF484 family)
MSTELNAQDVAEFLASNPNFFDENRDLLIDMKIPHESGTAVSLVEKQVTVMRERNNDLRGRLSQLIENARENDRLFLHSRKLVLAFLDCQNYRQLVDALHQSFELNFKVQTTSLILFNAPPLTGVRSTTMTEAQHHLGKYLKAQQTVGGGLDEQERQFLFGDKAVDIGSAALAVLSHGEIHGVLAVGNEDPSYYSSSMGTIFLSYIGEVLSRNLQRLNQAR